MWLFQDDFPVPVVLKVLEVVIVIFDIDVDAVCVNIEIIEPSSIELL